MAASVEICSACGFHEAILMLVGTKLPRRKRWPISVPWAVTTPHSELRVLRCLGFKVSASEEFENALLAEEAEVYSRVGGGAAMPCLVSSDNGPAAD